MRRNKNGGGTPKMDHGQKLTGKTKGTYATQGKGRRAEHYDRPAIEQGHATA